MRPTLPFLILATIACGCVVGRYQEGEPVRWEQLAAIRPGETTRSEVLRLLGAPDSLSSPSILQEFIEGQGLEPEETPRLPFEDVFTYQYTRGRLRGLFTLLYNRLSLEIASDLLVIFFDERDRVSYMGFRRIHDVPPGAGAADAL